MIKYVLCRLHTSWYVIYVHGRYNVKRWLLLVCQQDILRNMGNDIRVDIHLVGSFKKVAREIVRYLSFI